MSLSQLFAISYHLDEYNFYHGYSIIAVIRYTFIKFDLSAIVTPIWISIQAFAQNQSKEIGLKYLIDLRYIVSFKR